MKFKIEKYLLKKAEELAFITIKHDGDFQIEGYEIPKSNLDVPIKNEVLVKVKAEDGTTGGCDGCRCNTGTASGV